MNLKVKILFQVHIRLIVYEIRDTFFQGSLKPNVSLIIFQ